MSTDDSTARIRELEEMLKDSIRCGVLVTDRLDEHLDKILPLIPGPDATVVGMCILGMSHIIEKWEKHCDKYGSLTGNLIFKEKK